MSAKAPAIRSAARRLTAGIFGLTLRGLPALLILHPTAGWAQAAGSPFDTGAQSLLTFMLTIGAPVAALIIIGVCIAAMMGQVSWGAVFRTLVGIAGVFGAVQIVTWIRGLFGV